MYLIKTGISEKFILYSIYYTTYYNMQLAGTKINRIATLILKICLFPTYFICYHSFAGVPSCSISSLSALGGDSGDSSNSDVSLSPSAVPGGAPQTQTTPPQVAGHAAPVSPSDFPPVSTEEELRTAQEEEAAQVIQITNNSP